jgi:hypothetical protein
MLCIIFIPLGCVEREWTICSDPSDALVEVSGRQIGRTPVTISFTYYGEYEVILRKDGYEALEAGVDLKPPWYQWPVIDFFAEISIFTFHDRRESHHVLKKLKTPSEEDLLKRAEELRKRNTGG